MISQVCHDAEVRCLLAAPDLAVGGGEFPAKWGKGPSFLSNKTGDGEKVTLQPSGIKRSRIDSQGNGILKVPSFSLGGGLKYFLFSSRKFEGSRKIAGSADRLLPQHFGAIPRLPSFEIVAVKINTFGFLVDASWTRRGV